jgi:hypothetical protein
MPTRHQSDAEAGFGGGHGCHSAMNTDKRRNQVKFALIVI